MYRGEELKVQKKKKKGQEAQRPEATKAQTLPIKKGKEKGNYF